MAELTGKGKGSYRWPPRRCPTGTTTRLVSYVGRARAVAAVAGRCEHQHAIDARPVQRRPAFSLVQTLLDCIRDHTHGTSAELSDFWTPSPLCPHLVQMYSIEFTQPPILHLLLVPPSPTHCGRHMCAPLLLQVQLHHPCLHHDDVAPGF